MIENLIKFNRDKEPIDTCNQIGLVSINYIDTRKLHPILKWAGGKEQELKYIIPNLPNYFDNYYEPFVGSGAVYTAIKANKHYINDKSEELISLYQRIANKNNDLFFKTIDEVIHNWNLLPSVIQKNSEYFINVFKRYSQNKIDDNQLQDLLFDFILTHTDQFNGMLSAIFNFNIENFINEIKVNLIRKIKRMKSLERTKNKLPDNDILDNIETAFKSAFYMHFRHLYNNTKKYKINIDFRSAIFLFIRNYAYSGMFRYNSKGEFNVPYGGIAYNKKNFLKKVDYLKSKALKSLLNSSVIENLDFQDFLKKYNPKGNDFIFLDPPYDTEFSTYAKNEFNKKDQIRLANYLTKGCKGKWMLIIKNTDFISSLYTNNGLKIKSFDKTYLVSFMNRNDKSAEHLLITNY